jgi:hypothetical protein
LAYEPWLEEEIFQFQRAAYPRRDAVLIPVRWRWMFVESARRLGISPLVWVYRRDSAVVAHQGIIPIKVKLGAEERLTGWFVETMTLEHVRGKAIGPMIVQKALDHMPFNLSLGQTPRMREIQFAMGWQQVVPMETYALVINAKRVIASKISNRFARCATSAALHFRQRMHGITRRPRRTRSFRARSVDRFDERHDRLWENVKNDTACSAVRDASFLNWKFVDQPGQELLCLEIVEQDRVVGVAVVAFRDADDTYPYRRALLLDLLVSTADREQTWAALDEVSHACRARLADLIVFDVKHHLLEPHLTAYGFLRREATRVLLLALGNLDDRQRQLVTRSDSWFLTRADSDVDRPW